MGAGAKGNLDLGQEAGPLKCADNLPQLEGRSRSKWSIGEESVGVGLNCASRCRVDASCEDFSERVVATNLSRSGALLKNVDIELRCGEVIAIEYAHRQAYFRIVWVLNSGMPQGMQVAVHKLAESPCP